METNYHDLVKRRTCEGSCERHKNQNPPMHRKRCDEIDNTMRPSVGPIREQVDKPFWVSNLPRFWDCGHDRSWFRLSAKDDFRPLQELASSVCCLRCGAGLDYQHELLRHTDTRCRAAESHTDPASCGSLGDITPPVSEWAELR
jgi:hypothetical protein